MKLFKYRQNIRITRFFQNGKCSINTTYGLLESTLDDETLRAATVALETLADQAYEYNQISIMHRDVDLKVELVN